MSLRAVFIIIAVIYFISPLDLIPDRFGWISRIDDFAVMIYLWWKYKKIIAKNSTQPRGATDAPKEPPPSATRVERSPHEVLEVQSGATQEEIESSYKRLMTQYHPDKVTHLGPDLQKLAHEKTIEIQRAYEELTR
jgi:DnaJ-domain-containing protein 1